MQHIDPVATLFRTPIFVALGSEYKWKTIAHLNPPAKAHPDPKHYRY
ncbi:hypothetical protein ACEN8K_46505 [Variovorax sp. CT11-76]